MICWQCFWKTIVNICYNFHQLRRVQCRLDNLFYFGCTRSIIFPGNQMEAVAINPLRSSEPKKNSTAMINTSSRLKRSSYLIETLCTFVLFIMYYSKTVHYLLILHDRNPIARKWAWLSWVQTIVYVLPQSPQNYSNISSQTTKFMGPTWAHLGPVGPWWAPCWPHEPCYQGLQSVLNKREVIARHATWWSPCA